MYLKTHFNREIQRLWLQFYYRGRVEATVLLSFTIKFTDGTDYINNDIRDADNILDTQKR